VADGALQYVPFAALPAPAGHPGAGDPLIAHHQVVTLPSASALDALRRADRAPVDSSRKLAIFADPVLRAGDPRVVPVAPANSRPPARSEKETPPVPEALGIRSARESGLSTLDRLPFARAEADAIAAFAPPAQTLQALDFDASRENALAELGRYRIVHFATHALLNSEHPERSGILLSMVDRNGAPVDGFLRLQDVYNLHLNADLVVLSACRTALGKEVRGEGLIGLTRGFLYAGAPAVVASLWDVRDRSTAELMTRMYRAMFRDHLVPAAALRAAQTSMWSDPRWSAPAHWAGFTIQGDWQPLPLRPGR
jgi:CHAT domain-containing protein